MSHHTLVHAAVWNARWLHPCERFGSSQALQTPLLFSTFWSSDPARNCMKKFMQKLARSFLPASFWMFARAKSSVFVFMLFSTRNSETLKFVSLCCLLYAVDDHWFCDMLFHLARLAWIHLLVFGEPMSIKLGCPKLWKTFVSIFETYWYAE